MLKGFAKITNFLENNIKINCIFIPSNNQLENVNFKKPPCIIATKHKKY